MTAQAAADVCSSASTINPNILDSGMGGTGAVANSGIGGTGAVANSGIGGTGAVANSGMGGTGVTNDNGLGGTGMTADGGMGGTGITTGISTEHGGIGGTGDAVTTSLLPQDRQGGVAIIGVVTGFASICVNGQEVFYDKNTPVYDNGMAAKLSSLATGKMVILKADKVGGQLHARSIGLFDAVAGPVERIDSKLNQMQVMGQTVRLNQNTMQQIKDLSPNASVRVSGHRLDNGEIVATRVDIGKIDGASTIGLVTSLDHDSMVVNGTRIHIVNTNITNKNGFDKIKVGNEVRVSGVWDGRAMKADRVESQPITNSINRADSAIVEGYVRLGHENTMHLDGTEIQASQGNTPYSGIEKSHGKVVKIEMRRDNKGQWVYDKLEQRSGKLFEQHGAFKRDSDSNSGSELSSGSNNNGDMSSGNDNSGSSSGSNSGSGSGGNSGSSHDSSSGARTDSGSSHDSSSGARSDSGSSHDSSSGARTDSGSSHDSSSGARSDSGSSHDSSGSAGSGRASSGSAGGDRSRSSDGSGVEHGSSSDSSGSGRNK